MQYWWGRDLRIVTGWAVLKFGWGRDTVESEAWRRRFGDVPPVGRGRALFQSADVLPLTWGAFVVATVSGFLMFMSNAPAYSHNRYFCAKLLLLLLAGLNMALFQSYVSRDQDAWDTSLPTPRSARLAAGCSLLLWILVIATGRWIGFTMLAGY